MRNLKSGGDFLYRRNFLTLTTLFLPGKRGQPWIAEPPFFRFGLSPPYLRPCWRMGRWRSHAQIIIDTLSSQLPQRRRRPEPRERRRARQVGKVRASCRSVFWSAKLKPQPYLSTTSAPTIAIARIGRAVDAVLQFVS